MRRHQDHGLRFIVPAVGTHRSKIVVAKPRFARFCLRRAASGRVAGNDETTLAPVRSSDWRASVSTRRPRGNHPRAPSRSGSSIAHPPTGEGCSICITPSAGASQRHSSSRGCRNAADLASLLTPKAIWRATSSRERMSKRAMTIAADYQLREPLSVGEPRNMQTVKPGCRSQDRRAWRSTGEGARWIVVSPMCPSNRRLGQQLSRPNAQGTRCSSYEQIRRRHTRHHLSGPFDVHRRLPWPHQSPTTQTGTNTPTLNTRSLEATD